jgi:hypothetical protein
MALESQKKEESSVFSYSLWAAGRSSPGSVVFKTLTEINGIKIGRLNLIPGKSKSPRRSSGSDF